MRSRSYLPAAASRGAFTLIELLVIVGIMLMLTMITVRAVVPNTEARRIRESARMVDQFIHGARARAIETGRPFGVQLVPRADGKAFVLEYIQVPEPYAGDTLSSRARVIANNQIEIDDTGWRGLVQVGDTVMLNHSSRMFRIDNIVGFEPARWVLVSVDGGYPEYLPNTEVAYKVLRAPEKAGGELELLEPAVIDTYVSTVGDDPLTFSSGSIALLFSPGGTLMSAYTPTTGWHRPNEPLYLHVGKVENTPQQSIVDFDSYWISINHQTGLVVAAESAGPAPGYDPESAADFRKHLIYSRYLVRSKNTLGSR